MRRSEQSKSVKSRALGALRYRRGLSNFWNVLSHWKLQNMLPTHEHFSVLVYGPPWTWKTKIAERMKRLWPNCRVDEHTTNRPAQIIENDGLYGVVHELRLDQTAGYCLIIHTHRLVHQHPGGLSSDFEAVSVDKSRWFTPEMDAKLNRPKLYDLVPFWAISHEH